VVSYAIWSRGAMEATSVIRWLLISVIVMRLSFSKGVTEHPPILDNIALGKEYSLLPSPNYAHCTDAGDKTQLTDGSYTRGNFWTQKSTVGWKSVRYIEITIDLQAVLPISGISYHAAAGTAHVTWPLHIFIMVGQDLNMFHYAGDLVQMSAEHGIPRREGYNLHRYWTNELGTHGRYVKIVVYPDGPFTFTDEIEIYRGDSSLFEKPLAGSEIVDIDYFISEIELTPHVQRRLRDDLAAVRESVRNLTTRKKFENELDAIEKEIPTLQVTPSRDFRTVFPMNELHRRIFAVQAAVWRSFISGPLVFWQKQRWDMVSPTEPPRPSEVKVDVAMMKNEFRGAAFNISNCDTSSVSLYLSIAGLLGGTNPKYITVHDATFTDTKSGVPVIAALPIADNDGRYYLFQIEPGMTKQVWLTFNSKGLAAGEYSGTITIDPGANKIPLKLNVFPFTFPDQPTLHLGGWDYTDSDHKYDVTEQNRSLLIQHLGEHYVDTPWATRWIMPYGAYDEVGTLIDPPDASNFSKWIDRWPSARNYCVFLSVGSRFADFDVETPAFKNALTNWISWWVRKMAEWNIKPEQLILLLVDEPGTKKEDRMIIDYATVIKRAQPNVLIFEDVSWHDPRKATPELFRVCDILCPKLSDWIEKGKPFADFYTKQCRAGKELWFFSCSGATKLLDPYAYYLMQQWFCWKYGAKGSEFWAFGDSNGASSWNEYASLTGANTPVFLDAKTVTHGKHMEAIREGIEDYEYLSMLRDRIAGLEMRNVRSDDLTAAKGLLASGVDRVTACMTHNKMILWREQKDRSVADQVRIEILETLLRLKDL
jgi:hypothetical protein